MATKRMFSNDIVGSDAFLEMPSTTQALYFHLGMRCDDDGFVNPNVTMRMTGANKNDLDLLVMKRFLLAFKNGVVVIKHNRINNNWDSRDSKRTLYTEELSQLFLKENKAYTFDEKQGVPIENVYPKYLPTGTRRVTDGRREEKRIEESRREEDNTGAEAPLVEEAPVTIKKFKKPLLEEVIAYCTERKNKVDPENFIDHYDSNGWKIGGKSAMKDWKAAIRTWEKNNFSKHVVKKDNVLVSSHSKIIADKLKEKLNQ